jgi:hypothetical protein
MDPASALVANAKKEQQERVNNSEGARTEDLRYFLISVASTRRMPLEWMTLGHSRPELIPYVRRAGLSN